MFYKINEPDVSSESFDGEVLAINLKTGNYYSLRGSAAVIFKLLISGNSADDIVSTLVNFYSTSEKIMLTDLTVFIDLLLDNKLIKESSLYAKTIDSKLFNSVTKEYKKPILESYTDMQDLLLIDPIHEVDINSGWPNKIPNSKTDSK